MEYKKRTVPKELQVLDALSNRMELSDKYKQYLHHLQKGYEGEVMFDSLVKDLPDDCLILSDLLLQMNNNTFQIDSLIISDAIYLFEIKNFEGDYYYENDRIYIKPSLEISNPLTQLSRSESLLRQLLQTSGFNLPINASVVFINPEFTLYQAPVGKPIIYPTQLKRLLQQLNSSTKRLTKRHHSLAKKLTALHQKDSPFSKIPKYNLDELQKGIHCTNCRSFDMELSGMYCKCANCGETESIDNAALRNIAEIKLLFPEIKLTTTAIYEWCQLITKKRITRILKQNFNLVSSRRWTYFE